MTARGGRIGLLPAALAIALSACTYHVVGDSTMDQIEGANGGFGSTTPGCGYTGHLGVPAPCAIELTPPEHPIVVAAVSVWDAFATDMSAYSDAHAYYESFGATVVWVEVPPYDETPWTPAVTDALNVAVAAELGCDLVPWSIREPDPAMMVDELHYTTEGAMVVAALFEQLGTAEAC